MHGLSPCGVAQVVQGAGGAGTLVERAQPQTVRKATPAPADIPSSTKAGEDGDPKPLGVNLLCLHLISKPAKRLPKDMRMVMVVDPALHLPAQLAENLQSEFMGQPLSMALLTPRAGPKRSVSSVSAYSSSCVVTPCASPPIGNKDTRSPASPISSNRLPGGMR